MATYRVIGEMDGRRVELREGDEITSFRGEKARYIACKDPRKVLVVWLKDGVIQGPVLEYFPSVFGLDIEEAE